ncbi:hypothetical protein G0Q06_05530 [Puniceicoccales bacterium CK1056]|uniref:SxtJ n=1 Tax=Oceanipulchritudo coccoides TaxID=2706888 RepID=A0A6B2M279_9BACT|nr:hypothetical protein [Oceanipulchritudo coccoides]NDV61905.1 hypothetical protein [Oceanipulchritudo coccoides]
MLRLKENPVEWIKFTGVMGLSANLILWMLWWNAILPSMLLLAGIGLALLALGASFVRPRWFRGFYRGGMTVSFHIGQTFGKLLLVLFFFLLVMPMGLLLRLLGKDLLKIKINPEDATHWHPAKNNREFDRMF